MGINASVMKRLDMVFLIFLMASATGFSQTKTGFIRPTPQFPTTLFPPAASHTVVVSNAYVLGKPATSMVDDEINLFPKNYNWSADIRKSQHFKNMALDIRKQDINGRDLQRDVHYDVIQRVYYDNIPTKH